MPLPKEEAWFPAKEYGYGWGVPKKPQGWISLVTYIILISISQFITQDPLWMIGSNFILTTLFVYLAYLKGEKTSWRWGNTDSNSNSDLD